MPDSPLKIGFNVPFHEAIKAAQQREVILPDVYYGEQQGLVRQMAFSIAGQASLDQLQMVNDSLAAKLQNGQTFIEWQKDILESGALDLPKHRLDNIFRTNIQAAYNQGRWERFLQVRDTRPYLMYDAINDSRVRPAHLSMDGIIRTIDDPFWDTHAPLNGYRCRCRLISLTETQAQRRSRPGSEQKYYGQPGKEVRVNTTGNGLNKVVDEALMNPDKGFDYNPGKDLLEGVQRGITNREGKVNNMLLSELKTKLSEDMKVIDLPDFNSVQNKLMDLADKNPEWFPKGFNGINAVSNPELFAGFNPMAGIFYISAADELVRGFKPAQELTSALQKIQSEEPLSFNNEYALETLWHEITHGFTGIATNRYPLNTEPLMEGVVQLSARHSYHLLINKLGGTAKHQKKIIADGLAYQTVTQNLLLLIEKAGIPGIYFAGMIMSDGNWEWRLKTELANRLSISEDKINYLFNLAETKSISAYKAKIDVQIMNAQRNKGAF